MSNATVLIVDDEAAIREMVAMALDVAGYRSLEAEDSKSALDVVLVHKPDLILLDWMLPDITGLELARRLRRDDHTSEIPVILVTARDEEESKVKGFEAGVDDYITKPFSNRELLARIKAVLRRSSPKAAMKKIEVGPLCLDVAGQRVFVGDELLHLGPTEYRLLEFFMTHQDRAYSRVQLLDNVWGTNVYVEDRTVDVHIRRLRSC